MPKKTEYQDKVSLNFSNSLILSHTPDSIGLSGVGKKATTELLDVASNGFFDTASPNYHTYYPDVKPEDLKPDAETFIKPSFRALSEVIVHKRRNPIDFSKNGVLKASMNKLARQSVMIDHEQSVGNIIGSVSNVAWQKSYTTDAGILVPAGINSILLIDGKSHPNIARKIMMEPPAIHSTSVTVQFAWEPSHTFENINEFFSKIGQFDDKGELIRRIVTEVKRYHEISLVSHGADPYAQRNDADGEINDAEYASGVDSLSVLGEAKPKHYFFDYSNDIVSNHDTPPTNNNTNHNENLNLMKDYLILLATSLSLTFNVEDDESTLKTLIASTVKTNKDDLNELSGLKASKLVLDTELTTLKSTNSTLTTEVAELKEKVKGVENIEELKSQAALSITMLAERVEKVKTCYTKLKGDKADAAFITSLSSMSIEALSAQEKDLTTQLEDKYPGVCNDCKSHNVSRSSLTHTEEPPAGGGTAELKTDAEIAAEFSKVDYSSAASNLHVQTKK